MYFWSKTSVLVMPAQRILRWTAALPHRGTILANPYRDLPASSFWKAAVAAPPPEAVLPLPARRFAIPAGAPVATAGSCFAQELGRHLAALPGLALLLAEPPEPGQPLFSARYGNIYTVAQLVQLFDRAHGTLSPACPAWRRADGRFLDPCRPFLDRAGFASAAAVAEARAAHLAAVRRVFAECAVLVFTLGMTEAWRARADGTVVPAAPGVAGAPDHQADYAFHNAGTAEVAADLAGLVARLRGVNPGARLILTVSPVPLVATATAEHVLVANARSKSVLRAACAEAEAAHPALHYFPAYEIVTGPHSRGAWYQANLRSVTAAGVAQVMAGFRAAFLPAATAPAAAEDPEEAVPCDEEEIVRSIGF